MTVPSISRRDFISATTGSVALATTLKSAERKVVPFKLRYVLSTSLYGTLPIADIVPEVHPTGSEALDIWAGRWGNQREQIDALGHEAFADLLKKHRARVGTYTCMDPGFPESEPHMRTMRKFGGDMIIAGFGGGGAGAKLPGGDELRRGIRTQIGALKPIIAKAGELNVKLAIENHLGGLLASPESLKILVEEIPEQHVGVALAPYHLPQDPELLGRLVGDLGERILFFYAWQHGDGSGDIPPEAQK
jgi:sugar phosphate isomerase/epimerase